MARAKRYIDRMNNNIEMCSACSAHTVHCAGLCAMCYRVAQQYLAARSPEVSESLRRHVAVRYPRCNFNRAVTSLRQLRASRPFGGGYA